MHRIDTSTADPNANGSGKAGFTDGDPLIPTPPTRLDASWFNDVQEEICLLIESNGIALVEGTKTQLLTAFRSPVGVAATSSTGGTAISGTGGSATTGVGGTGLKGTGGLTSAGTGAGGAGLWGVGGTSFGGSAGIGVLGDGAGTPVSATPNSGSGVVGRGGATNGRGGEFFGKGTGRGLYGVGVDGYGIVAESDTTSPQRAAFRIVPQDADPSTSPAAGDVYVNSTSGMVNARKGGSEWARYLGKVKGITTAITSSIGSDSSGSAGSHSVPAGTLLAGSVIRIKIAGTATDVSGLPTFNLNFGGVAAANGSAQLTNATNRFLIEATITLRAVGASVAAAYVVAYETLSNTTYTRRFDQGTYSGVDTTSAAVVDLIAAAGEGGATIRVDTFVVDISD